MARPATATDGPSPRGAGRPSIDLAGIPRGATTRFAPAPTGYLHLGHVANAIYVWGIARAVEGRVLLRIEDHDRQRYRPQYDAAILEDLGWLGFEADDGPIRQSDDDEPYATTLTRLRADGLVYACDCTRSTFARWAARHGRPWASPGCPGGCRERGLDDRPGRVIRLVLGDGEERWDDVLLGPRSGPVAAGGDPPARDRHGSWTYGFSVVVDDLRQRVDLVIRGQDLLDATPDQIRLARLLGRPKAARFLHHPLIRRPDGTKLSKAGRATSVRELRAAGWPAERILGQAAAGVGLLSAPVEMAIGDIARLFMT